MAKFSKFKRGMGFALFGLATLCVAGCETTSYTQQSSNVNSCYDQFFSSYGDYRLVRKGTHLVRQKMDCTENIEIPYESYCPPSSRLLEAGYSKDGKYILWCIEPHNDYLQSFRIDSNLDIKTLQKIDGYEYFDLKKKWNPE